LKAYELMAKAAAEPKKYEGKRYKVDGCALHDPRGRMQDRVIIRNGALEIDGANDWAYINSNTLLEEIPQPVSFMEAANSGKRIKPTRPNEGKAWDFHRLDHWIRLFGQDGGNPLFYLNSQWLIEG